MSDLAVSASSDCWHCSLVSYSVSYSNDSNVWFYYKDANHLEAKVDNTQNISMNHDKHVSCVAKQINTNTSTDLCVNQAWSIYFSSIHTGYLAIYKLYQYLLLINKFPVRS